MFTHTYTKQYLSLIKNTSSNKGDKYLLSGDACNFLPLEAPNKCKNVFKLVPKPLFPIYY